MLCTKNAIQSQKIAVVIQDDEYVHCRLNKFTAYPRLTELPPFVSSLLHTRALVLRVCGPYPFPLPTSDTARFKDNYEYFKEGGQKQTSVLLYRHFFKSGMGSLRAYIFYLLGYGSVC